MSDNRTLQQVRDDAAARADMTVTASTFVTITQANVWVNLAIAELRDIMIAEMGDDWLATVSTPAAIIANTDRYTLPTDCYKALGVDVSMDNQVTWQSLERFEFSERNKFATSSVWGGLLPAYRLFGTQVMFRPIPATGIGVYYRIWHIPTITRLVNDSDTFDFVHGWDDWVACRVAIRMLVKEESDTSALVADLALIQQRIIGAVRHRDAGTPKRVQDTQRLSSSSAYGRNPNDEGSWI